MIQLRPYQSGALDAVRNAYRENCRAPLLVAPTGSGKTCMFAEITRSAAKRGKRVLLLAHRIELVDQIIAALTEADTPCDVIAAGYGRRRGSVIVASVQTLVRRLENVPAPDLIIIDEAHHVASGNTWSKVLAEWPNAHRLGVTATPVRLDGRGLGENFDRMIMGPTVAELTAQGFLAPARMFAPPSMDTSELHMRHGEYVHAEVEALADKPSITGDALTHYRKYAAGKPAIVFCTSIAHAEHVATQFREGGFQAASLNGGTAPEIRRRAMDEFRRGVLQVMASCDLFGEGLDVPGIHVGILLRPTASMGLYLQQVGRCLRVAPGKEQAVILDHAGNVSRFGLPTDPRDWALTYDETKRRAKPSISIRVCPKCWAASSARARVCTNCGKEFEVEARKIEEREGELAEITPEMLERRRARQDQGRARSLDELRAFAKMKGYANGWAMRVWAARQAKVRG